MASEVPAFTGTERGHPSFEVQVAIPPGQSGELGFHLSEPTSPGAPRVPVQPLVDNVTPVDIGARMLQDDAFDTIESKSALLAIPI